MTDVGYLTVDDCGDLVTWDGIFPNRKMRDITRAVQHIFFQPIPSDFSVRKGSMCVIGDQGCGKSVFLESISALCCKQYGKENVHVVYTDDVRVALDLIDDKPVQLLIIDDAMTNASSRKVGEQTDILKVYNRSRHVFEEHLHGQSGGVILYIWAWQRFKELDPSFRQCDAIVFKTGISEPTESKLIEGFIGPGYLNELNKIWYEMKQGNDEIKSQSVARISSLDIKRGTGKMIVPMIKNPDFPRMITHDEHFADEDTENDILEEYIDKPEWRWRIEIHRLHQEQPELTQKEIADMIGDRRGSHVRQGYVSESLRKVKELVEAK